MIGIQEKLIESFHSSERVSGLTHNFYRYPARFAPGFARDVILEFSKEGDCVLDAFMGGGTTIVEAIANGRNALGVDINPLAYFVAKVKTTPLSSHDQESIVCWANGIDFEDIVLNRRAMSDPQLKNMPEETKDLLIRLVSTIDKLEFPRQRTFARCALLRLGQWAIDCRHDIPSASHMRTQLVRQVEEMLRSLNDLVEAAGNRGIPKNKITGMRALYLGTVNEAIEDNNFAVLSAKPKLVLTSPPYPGVHVLYHRWQVGGRRETPAPYWLAGLRDGHGESHYTLGGRSITGLKSYFLRLTNIFGSLHQFIHPDALVIQLVAFSRPDTQLPAFLDAMYLAGYEELTTFRDSCCKRLSRRVPNRKWYTYLDKNQHASNEVLLIHRLRK